MNVAARVGGAFAAGSLGGLANVLVVWGAGVWGATAALGVAIAPPLTKAMVYQRMVWGGIWGLVFLIPLLKGTVLYRGFLWSLLPSLVTLLYIFPHVAMKGWWGQELGTLTPVCVFIFNAVWGWVTAWWLDMARQ